MSTMQEAMNNAGISKLQPKAATQELPDLSKLTVEAIPDIAAIDKNAQVAKTWLHDKALVLVRQTAAQIAPVLGLPGQKYDLVSTKVEKNVTTVCSIIFAESGQITDNMRGQLRATFVQDILIGMDRTEQALVRFVDNVALRVGIFANAEENDKDAIELPVTPAPGERFQRSLYKVYPGHRDAHRITGILRAIAQEVRQAKREVRQERTDALREGTSGYFADLVDGNTNGIVVIDAATEPVMRDGKPVVVGDKEPVRYGGKVRLEVKNGRISPASVTDDGHKMFAVGGCARKVARMAELGITVPLASVLKDRIEMGRFKGGDEQFKLTLELHRLCRSGYLNDLERKPRRDERAAIAAMQTVGQLDWLKGNIGTTRFFLTKQKDYRYGKEKPAWTWNDKQFNLIDFAVNRREDGQIAIVVCLGENEELFAGCREYAEPGEKFNGLPDPLRQMLHKLFAMFTSRERKSVQNQAPNVKDIEQTFLKSAGESGT